MHKKILLMINFDESNVILVNNYGTNCENIVPRITFFFPLGFKKRAIATSFLFLFFSLVEKTLALNLKK